MPAKTTFCRSSTGTVPSITSLEHAFPRSALPLLSTCPCHRSLHLLIASRIASTVHTASLQFCIFLRETPHTYLIIVISGLSVFESRSGLTAHVSHPCKQLIIRGVHTWLNMSPTNSGNYPHRHTSPSTSKPFSLTSINYYIEPLHSIVSPHLLFTPLHLR